MSLLEALSRTILLARTYLRPETSDDTILDALTALRVVIRASPNAMATHAGQTCLVTTALTIARSGHQVWIDAPEAAALGPQPPLEPGPIIRSLESAGRDLLPGVPLALGCPAAAHLEVRIGHCGSTPIGDRTIWLEADDWRGRMSEEPCEWSGGDWPLGAIAASVMAASEAFKAAMRLLQHHAADAGFFGALHRPCTGADLPLAPPGSLRPSRLKPFDVISAGAIANAVLFAVLRCDGVSGACRVMDDDASALSNLNRNALLLRSALDRPKVDDLARFAGRLSVAAVPRRFGSGDAVCAHVLAGVDHIPSRWTAQAAGPDWLGIGATEGFAALVSSHRPGEPCAGCLHPVAAVPSGPIPTAAFVSLLSGLLLAARWLRAQKDDIEADEQQVFVNALRPEGWASAAGRVAPQANCPVGCPSSRRLAA